MSISLLPAKGVASAAPFLRLLPSQKRVALCNYKKGIPLYRSCNKKKWSLKKTPGLHDKEETRNEGR
jgi:hypothetical protein